MIISQYEPMEIQKGIYFDCQIRSSIAYNMSVAISMMGLDIVTFEDSIKLLIEEQEALRSAVKIDTDGLPVMVVYDNVNFELEIMSTEISNSEDEGIKKIIKLELSKEIDLYSAPLFRTKIIKLLNEQYVFILCIHHIIADGTSVNILIKKLFKYYEKLSVNKTMTCSSDSGYADFSIRENERVKIGKYEAQKKYWTNKMSNIASSLLQKDFKNKSSVKCIGVEKRLYISNQIQEKIYRLAAEQEVSTFMFCLGVFGVLIHKYYTINERSVISIPFSYRLDEKVEETIGCFVAMLPFQFDIKADYTFSAVIQKVRMELITVYSNIGYPINLVLRNNNSMSLLERSSVFNVSFVYDKQDDVVKTGLLPILIEQDDVAFSGNLIFTLFDGVDGFHFKIQYKQDVFSNEVIEHMGKRFVELLELLLDNPYICLSDVLN
ncbi:MAG: condensation domain-containing protein [Defluviitaleaceae bacterium]|nr:condensation domain-containing protein [Defluviitaleaceae bacterium]